MAPGFATWHRWRELYLGLQSRRVCEVQEEGPRVLYLFFGGYLHYLGFDFAVFGSGHSGTVNLGHGRGRPIGESLLDDVRVGIGHCIHGHLGVCLHYFGGGFWFDLAAVGASNLWRVRWRPVGRAGLDDLGRVGFGLCLHGQFGFRFRDDYIRAYAQVEEA